MIKITRTASTLASLGLLASALTVAAAPSWAVTLLTPAPAVATDSTGHEYLFWENANQGLETAKYTDSTGWSTPSAVTVDGHGMGPLGSEPTVAVDYNTGYQYVFWEGTNQQLWEAYYNQNGWHGPDPTVNIPGGMGCAPSAVQERPPGRWDVDPGTGGPAPCAPADGAAGAGVGSAAAA